MTNIFSFKVLMNSDMLIRIRNTLVLFNQENAALKYLMNVLAIFAQSITLWSSDTVGKLADISFYIVQFADVLDHNH